MKARPKKPGARSTAARKPAVAQGAKSVSAARRTAPKAARAAKAPAKRAAMPAIVTVGADCTIEHAPGLHEQLSGMLAQPACVTVDVAAVKRADTAGLQVLAAFVRERREAGQPVEIRGASETFVDTAQLIGLSVLFGLDALGVPDARAAQAEHA